MASQEKIQGLYAAVLAKPALRMNDLAEKFALNPQEAQILYAELKRNWIIWKAAGPNGKTPRQEAAVRAVSCGKILPLGKSLGEALGEATLPENGGEILGGRLSKEHDFVQLEAAYRHVKSGEPMRIETYFGDVGLKGMSETQSFASPLEWFFLRAYQQASRIAFGAEGSDLISFGRGLVAFVRLSFNFGILPCLEPYQDRPSAAYLLRSWLLEEFCAKRGGKNGNT
jgi:hypothetical protein